METLTCQICGRGIKAKNGLIAHHGYRRPGDGYQTSSCLGARFQPYEVTCDRIPDVIKIYESSLEAQRISLSKFLAEPPATLTKPVFIGYSQVETYNKPEGFDPVKNATAVCFSYHSQRYESEYAARVRSMRNNIKYMKEDIQFLQKRLTDWKAPVAVTSGVV